MKALVAALKPWVNKLNFISYTDERSLYCNSTLSQLHRVSLFLACSFLAASTPRDLKHKDVDKLTAYLPHLKRIQSDVEGSWNINFSTVQAAVRQINEELCEL